MEILAFSHQILCNKSKLNRREITRTPKKFYSKKLFLSRGEWKQSLVLFLTCPQAHGREECLQVSKAREAQAVVSGQEMAVRKAAKIL